MTTDPPPRRGRRRGLVAAAAGLAAVAVVAAALAPSWSGSSSPSHFGVRVTAAHAATTANPLGVRITRVVGTNIPASLYGTEVADQEDRGVNLAGQMISDLSPIPPRAFRAPENAYRAYAVHWTTVTSTAVVVLRRALTADDRAAAQAAWTTAWSDYLHLGAVYGLFGTLDQAIDGTPGVLPGGTASPRFTGLHRVEMGLWTGASPRSLVPFADGLLSNLARLRVEVPSVPITPLVYATRAHEILEDAQRDFLSGTDVPWSGAGVAGTAAGLAATQEVIGTLVPLLQGRDNALAEVQTELGLLAGVDRTILRDHHGRWPTLGQLSVTEHEQLNGTVAGALVALSTVPGTLETTNLPVIPAIPRGR